MRKSRQLGFAMLRGPKIINTSIKINEEAGKKSHIATKDLEMCD